MTPGGGEHEQRGKRALYLKAGKGVGEEWRIGEGEI